MKEHIDAYSWNGRMTLYMLDIHMKLRTEDKQQLDYEKLKSITLRNNDLFGYKEGFMEQVAEMEGNCMINGSFLETLFRRTVENHPIMIKFMDHYKIVPKETGWQRLGYMCYYIDRIRETKAHDKLPNDVGYGETVQRIEKTWHRYPMNDGICRGWKQRGYCRRKSETHNCPYSHPMTSKGCEKGKGKRSKGKGKKGKGKGTSKGKKGKQGKGKGNTWIRRSWKGKSKGKGKKGKKGKSKGKLFALGKCKYRPYKGSSKGKGKGSKGKSKGKRNWYKGSHKGKGKKGKGKGKSKGKYSWRSNPWNYWQGYRPWDWPPVGKKPHKNQGGDANTQQQQQATKTTLGKDTSHTTKNGKYCEACTQKGSSTCNSPEKCKKVHRPTCPDYPNCKRTNCAYPHRPGCVGKAPKKHQGAVVSMNAGEAPASPQGGAIMQE